MHSIASHPYAVALAHQVARALVAVNPRICDADPGWMRNASSASKSECHDRISVAGSNQGFDFICTHRSFTRFVRLALAPRVEADYGGMLYALQHDEQIIKPPFGDSSKSCEPHLEHFHLSLPFSGLLLITVDVAEDAQVKEF